LRKLELTHLISSLELSMPSISVIIITKNEELHIRDCIKSVQGVANEVIVVDSKSDDKTVQIAESLGAKVTITEDWQGFGLQKNKALSLAKCDWVLSIDADERLTPDLAKEIQSVLINEPKEDGFLITRKSWYCGKLIHHSGWQNDKVLRLFRRGSAVFTDSRVHEKLNMLEDSNLKELGGLMLHYSFADYEEVLDKINRYSTLWATEQLSRGKKSTPSRAVLHGIGAFIKTYIFKLGFLDGFHGLTLAVSNAEGAYYKYIKLWHLGQKSQN